MSKKTEEIVINDPAAVSPRQARPLIEHCIRLQQPLFLRGSPGLGKSQLIAQIAAEWDQPADLPEGAVNPNARKVIDIRLLLLDPTDLRGLPYIDDCGDVCWAQPSDLPSTITQATVDKLKRELAAEKKRVKALDNPELIVSGNKAIKLLTSRIKKSIGNLEFQTAIVLLDELPSAAPMTQNAAYQLVLDRKVGDYTLPEGVSLVACGNKLSDKGGVNKMPTPLANRFVHLELISDADDWVEWAVNNHINSGVIGFISHHKHKLFTFDAKNNELAFATGRSWEFVSKILNDTSGLTEAGVSALVSGTIGSGLALEFMAHRRVADKLPKAIDVLTGKVTTIELDEISAKFSLAISLCYELKAALRKRDAGEITTEKYNSFVNTFFTFCMDNFESEMVIMSAVTAIRSYKLEINNKDLPAWKTFYKKFGKYILES